MSANLDVKLTENFSVYLHELRDLVGKRKIVARLKRLAHGNWGDAAPIGDGLIELRIDTGPGYRVYCRKVGLSVVVILGGGTKNRQQADINAAKLRAIEL